MAYHCHRGFDNIRLISVGPKLYDKINENKQRRRNTVRKSLRRPIVLGSTLKSSRKKISRFCFLKIGRSPYFMVLQLGSSEKTNVSCRVPGRH